MQAVGAGGGVTWAARRKLRAIVLHDSGGCRRTEVGGSTSFLQARPLREAALKTGTPVADAQARLVPAAPDVL